MTRVSSYGQGQALIEQMLRNQRSTFEQEQRVATGKKAQDFKGVNSDINVLMGARSAARTLEAQKSANLELAQKLEVYNATLGALADVAEAVRQDLINAVNLNSGTGLMDKMRAHYERATELVNTRYQNRYLLNGGQDGTPPLAGLDPSALILLPSGASAFQDGTQKALARVDDSQTMQYGELGSEVAGDLFDLFHRMFEFESGSLPAGAAGGSAGSYDQPLAPGQRDFLVGEFSRAVSATQTVRAAEARTGVRMQTLENIMERQATDLSFTRGFVSNLEDADMGDAIAKLQQGQTSLEASLQMVARIGRLSLLDFI